MHWGYGYKSESIADGGSLQSQFHLQRNRYKDLF